MPTNSDFNTEQSYHEATIVPCVVYFKEKHTLVSFGSSKGNNVLELKLCSKNQEWKKINEYPKDVLNFDRETHHNIFKISNHQVISCGSNYQKADHFYLYDYNKNTIIFNFILFFNFVKNN